MSHLSSVILYVKCKTFSKPRFLVYLKKKNQSYMKDTRLLLKPRFLLNPALASPIKFVLLLIDSKTNHDQRYSRRRIHTGHLIPHCHE